MQGKGCMEKLFRLRHFAHSREFLKDTVYIFANVFICGHQTIIGIDTGIGGMVVPCSQMYITHQFIVFTAYNKDHFGMGFITDNAINHDSTRLLQHIGHFNIGFFIETGTQLNDSRHLFTITRCFCQNLYNFRIRPTTVQRLFNCQYLWITRCFT